MRADKSGDKLPGTAVLEVVFAGGFLLLFLAILSRAAQVPGTSQSVPARTLKVSTNVVNVYAVVRDKQRRLIPDLKREDFELTEENARQEIGYFTRQTDTPLTLGILMDTSLSQEQVLKIEQEQARAFVVQVIRPNDLAFVIHYDVEVELVKELTGDAQLLARAIDETVINKGISPSGPGSVPCPGGGRSVFDKIFRVPGDDKFQAFPTPDIPNTYGDTHLHDAVYLAANEILRNEAGRKALLVLGDGVDQGSRMKLNAALEAAHRSDVVIYCLAIVDRLYHTDFCRQRRACLQGPSVLRKLAEETGGRVIEVTRARDTARAFQEIAEELRTQYFLGYTPSHLRHDGSYRRIRLSVRKNGFKVQARRGYYAPRE